MSEVFELSEANFYADIRNVQKIIAVSFPSEHQLMQANQSIREAAQELSKMEIEFNISPEQSQWKAKIDIFKEEYRKYKRELSKKEKEVKEKELELTASENSNHLFEKEESLEKGIDPLLEAKRQMYENEAMSNQINESLQKDTETLKRNMNRMGEIDGELTVAQKLLNSIKNKMKRNKRVLCGTLIFVMLMTIIIIYTYFNGTRNNRS